MMDEAELEKAGVSKLSEVNFATELGADSDSSSKPIHRLR